MSEILGVLFAALLGLSLIPGYLEYQRTSTENLRAVTTAQQQKIIYAAATKYLEQNNAAVLANAGPTTPVVLTVGMLQTATTTLLPVTNPYGQTWQVQVLEPTAGSLQAIVTATGGDALRDKQAVQVASIVGATGGFIPLNDTGAFAGGAANAWGTKGGWQIPTAGYTGIVGGRPAALLTVVGGQVANNYLYRNAVPGQPQLNQMSAALDMTGNSVNNVGTLNGGQAALSRDGTGACCNPNGQTLALSENTQATGRRPTIQFHSGGAAEGYIELSGVGEVRRLNLKDNQGQGLGLNTTGTISAPRLELPNGANLQAGGLTVTNNGTDTGLRQSGQVFIERLDGSAAGIAKVANINASGDIVTSASVYTGGNVNVQGLVQTAQNWWSMIARDGAWADNVQAQSTAGSINVNDIYIRSIGKWASQLNSTGFTTAQRYNIPASSSYYNLGVHKMCTLSGIQNGWNTTVGNSWNYLNGSWNGNWTWQATGKAPDFAQVTCFD